MKIIYHGYYGHRNPGDDAFMEAAAWGTQKYWGCTDHMFLSAGAAPKILTDIQYFSPHTSYTNFLKTIYKIFNADVFVSAGGSTFHSALKKTDVRTYAKIKKRLIKKAVAGAIGISLGPYRNTEGEKNTIEYLKKLNFLALRDEYSYGLACSYNLPYQPVNAFDLAGLLPLIYTHETNNNVSAVANGEKIIGISICNYESYINVDVSNEQKRNEYLYSALTQLLPFKNVKFKFFIFNGNPVSGDEEVTMQLIAKLKHSGLNNFEIIPYINEVKKVWAEIKKCDLIICGRLHAGVFACFANVPFLMLEYHRKCTDFLDSIGYNKDYRAFDAERNIVEFVDVAYNILFNNNYKYPLNKSVCEKKALLNFTETKQSACMV